MEQSDLNMVEKEPSTYYFSSHIYSECYLSQSLLKNGSAFSLNSSGSINVWGLVFKFWSKSGGLGFSKL